VRSTVGGGFATEAGLLKEDAAVEGSSSANPLPTQPLARHPNPVPIEPREGRRGSENAPLIRTGAFCLTASSGYCCKY